MAYRELFQVCSFEERGWDHSARAGLRAAEPHAVWAFRAALLLAVALAAILPDRVSAQEPAYPHTPHPGIAIPVAMRTEHESIHQRLVSATKAPGRTGHYPTATANGAMHYEETVSLGALRAAFGKAFEGRDLDLDTRVVYLHGVPSGTALPPSVASLGPIPAHVTLPIACGEIRRVR